MNASEKIVNAWLHSKGYFTIANIMLFQRQEIDILAVKPDGNELKREHYEVHVSITPIGSVRARGPVKTSHAPFEQRIKEVYEHSFIGTDGKKREEVIKRFRSNDYEMVHVRSRRIKVKQDISLERIKEEFGKYNVKVVWFEDILKELTAYIKTQGRTCSEETLSFVQLCNEFANRP